MVPSAFVRMEALPLNANGKLDQAALPEPEAPSAAAWVAPRTATEELIAGLWAEVLGLPRVSAQAGFFDLGGHSLLATQVVSRVRATFGIELPLAHAVRGADGGRAGERVRRYVARRGRPHPLHLRAGSRWTHPSRRSRSHRALPVRARERE